MNKKYLIILILVIIFLFFGLYKARVFLEGPKIVIESPIDGQVFTASDVEVSGQASNVSLLYLNGRQIFTDQNGNFKENLLLARGYNILQIEAKDKFNREVKTKKEVVLK
jgi:hypothetical protein